MDCGGAISRRGWIAIRNVRSRREINADLDGHARILNLGRVRRHEVVVMATVIEFHNFDTRCLPGSYY